MKKHAALYNKRRTSLNDSTFFPCNATLSPIDFLPDELLGETFHEVFLLHPDKPHLHGGCSTEFDASWTRLMLVCRRWRQVGLTEHRTWSYISDSSRSYKGLSIRQRLARSSHHLLTCRFDLGREPNEVGFLLNEHGGRIRGLEVTENAFQFDAIFNGVSKLPSLRELIARCATRYIVASIGSPTSWMALHHNYVLSIYTTCNSLGGDCYVLICAVWSSADFGPTQTVPFHYCLSRKWYQLSDIFLVSLSSNSIIICAQMRKCMIRPLPFVRDFEQHFLRDFSLHIAASNFSLLSVFRAPSHRSNPCGDGIEFRD